MEVRRVRPKLLSVLPIPVVGNAQGRRLLGVAVAFALAGAARAVAVAEEGLLEAAAPGDPGTDEQQPADEPPLPASPPPSISLTWLLATLVDARAALWPHLPVDVRDALASLDVAALDRAGIPEASAVLLLAVPATLLVVWAATAFAAALIRGARALGGAAGGGPGRRRTVVMVGPCGGGKTALCHRLCHGRDVQTVTSMRKCQYTCRANGAGAGSSGGDAGSSDPATALVDYPGHARLRAGLREELARSSAVVFVIDAADLSAQVQAGAELLYDVLTDPSLERSRGLLIACSKADVKAARPARVKTLFQRELDKLRATRGTLSAQGGGGDGSGGGGGGGALPLGRQGEPLDLDVDSPCEVSVAACSARTGDVAQVREFILG